MEDKLSTLATADRRLGIATAVVVSLFLVIWMLGRWGPAYMANGKCYEILGCNNGFFGYDAVVHFVSGIMDALLLVWVTVKRPVWSLFKASFWKNFLVIIAVAALVAVSWEFVEMCHDQFNIKVLHNDLVATDSLDQPTNDDTMGDMTFTIAGAAVAACAVGPFLRKKEELST